MTPRHGWPSNLMLQLSSGRWTILSGSFVSGRGRASSLGAFQSTVRGGATWLLAKDQAKRDVERARRLAEPNASGISVIEAHRR